MTNAVPATPSASGIPINTRIDPPLAKRLRFDHPIVPSDRKIANFTVPNGTQIVEVMKINPSYNSNVKSSPVLMKPNESNPRPMSASMHQSYQKSQSSITPINMINTSIANTRIMNPVTVQHSSNTVNNYFINNSNINQAQQSNFENNTNSLNHKYSGLDANTNLIEIVKGPSLMKVRQMNENRVQHAMKISLPRSAQKDTEQNNPYITNQRVSNQMTGRTNPLRSQPIRYIRNTSIQSPNSQRPVTVVHPRRYQTPIICQDSRKQPFQPNYNATIRTANSINHNVQFIPSPITTQGSQRHQPGSTLKQEQNKSSLQTTSITKPRHYLQSTIQRHPNTNTNIVRLPTTNESNIPGLMGSFTMPYRHNKSLKSTLGTTPVSKQSLCNPEPHFNNIVSKPKQLNMMKMGNSTSQNIITSIPKAPTICPALNSLSRPSVSLGIPTSLNMNDPSQIANFKQKLCDRMNSNRFNTVSPNKKNIVEQESSHPSTIILSQNASIPNTSQQIKQIDDTISQTSEEKLTFDSKTQNISANKGLDQLDGLQDSDDGAVEVF